jgi:hypothetical protein
MVRTAIKSHIPEGEWERLMQIEQQEKTSFREAMSHITKRGA